MKSQGAASDRLARPGRATSWRLPDGELLVHRRAALHTVQAADGSVDQSRAADGAALRVSVPAFSSTLRPHCHSFGRKAVAWSARCGPGEPRCDWAIGERALLFFAETEPHGTAGGPNSGHDGDPAANCHLQLRLPSAARPAAGPSRCTAAVFRSREMAASPLEVGRGGYRCCSN